MRLTPHTLKRGTATIALLVALLGQLRVSSAACPPAPSESCRHALSTRLTLVSKGDHTHDKLSIRFNRGQSATFAELANPTATAEYRLCLYAGGSLALGADVPAGGTCSGKPCWAVQPTKGFKFKDKTAENDGILTIRAKASLKDRTSIQAKGRGAALTDLSLPLAEPVVAEMHNVESGLCFTTSYSGAEIRENDSSSGKLKAKKRSLSYPTTPPPPPGSVVGEVVGYFEEWGVYAANYHVKNIVTSGSAARLTRINYAFGNVVSNLCQLGDPYADYDKFYNAGASVDATSDSWAPGALRGSFNQLRKLKILFPHLKVLISLGGWTWSSGFSDAALPENRAAFVQSCIDLFINDPRWVGVFDGIDIDWEYPGTCGNTCSFRPEDTQNFTALLGEFRSQLDAVNPSLLLTIAAPAAVDKVDQIEVAAVSSIVDSINLLTYDFHGAWDPVTGLQSALYSSPLDPSVALNLTVDDTVHLWLTRGATAGKLIVGVPFYGHGWEGVSPTNNGLWQPSTGAAPGTWAAGVEDYKTLRGLGHLRYFDPAAQAAWLFDNGVFWTFDDAPVMSAKRDYIRTNGLGGVMFWELSGDTTDGELIRTLTTEP